MQELNGYVKLFRKIRRWRWYNDVIIKAVFLECLLLATYKEAGWNNENLKPGELITSYVSLSQNLGISVQQARTAIKKLQATGEISVKATNKYTLITVNKWSNYQLLDAEPNNQITNKQQSKNNQATNNQQHLNNIKNIKNRKNIKKDAYESAYPNVPDLTKEYLKSLL